MNNTLYAHEKTKNISQQQNRNYTNNKYTHNNNTPYIYIYISEKTTQHMENTNRKPQ